MRELLKDFYKKGPEKFSDYREFDFENGTRLIFRILEDEPSFRFIDKEGKDLVDLSSFAPAGTRLEMNRRDRTLWEANPAGEGRPVILIGECSEGAKAILSFLHEAGHLHNSFDHELIARAKRKYRAEIRKDGVNAYPSSRLLAMKEERSMIMKSERDAWAFAFQKTRELERQLNITIFERLGSQGPTYERARIFAGEYLATYEKTYLDELEGLDIFGKKQMEEFFKSLEPEGTEE